MYYEPPQHFSYFYFYIISNVFFKLIYIGKYWRCEVNLGQKNAKPAPKARYCYGHNVLEIIYIAGWNGSPGNGIMLDLFDASSLGLDNESVVNGKAFPNPTNENVTIALEANGNGQLMVTDVAGKAVLNQMITLVNGQTNVDMSNLDAGVYIFNVTLENGKSSQFNVVKN